MQDYDGFWKSICCSQSTSSWINFMQWKQLAMDWHYQVLSELYLLMFLTFIGGIFIFDIGWWSMIEQIKYRLVPGSYQKTKN